MSASGKPSVVTRSLQLTQKQDKKEMKTIDGSVSTVNDKGEVINKQK